MPREAHQPDPKSRSTVEAMAAYGAPQADIARVLGISDKTLRKHYPSELENAALKANAQVAQSLFQQATGSPAQFDAKGRQLREEQRRVPAAAMFWLKCRAGWKEVSKVEHSGAVALVTITPDKLKDLTEDELKRLDAALPVLEKLGLVGSHSGGEGEKEG